MAKQIWQADDGKTFDTEEQAQAWEQRVATSKELERILRLGTQVGTLEDLRRQATPSDIARFLVDQVPAAVEALLAWGAEHKSA
jgi:hypothetical protein